MNVRARLAAIERRLPRPPAKAVLIRSGPRSHIKPHPGWEGAGLTLRVPCEGGPSAMMAALTPAQRACIGPYDRVWAVSLADGRLERVAIRGAVL